MTDVAAAARESEAVRKATRDELPRLAAVLAGAFYDDPQFTWMLPDDARRRRALEPEFALLLRHVWFAQGQCYTTGGIAGAAVWGLPGEWRIGFAQQLRLLVPMARQYGRSLPRLLRALFAVERNHPKEPHYYLVFAGVDPEWQGRGIGSALMRPVLDRCDGDGVPAYLEASTPRNRALYERHGFEVTEELAFAKDAPPFWRMWREPAA